MSNSLSKHLNILSKFPIKEKILDVKPIGNGHINDTLAVTVEEKEGEQYIKYILQRINSDIFKDVEGLQDNIFAVTTHITQKLQEQGAKDLDRKVLTFLHASNGRKYHFDGEGGYWRVCLFIPNSISYEAITPELAFEAGKAFGEFQCMLADIPEGVLKETIPHFHDMTFRLEEFRSAVKADKVGRASKVSDIIEEIEERAEQMTIQDRMFAEGKLVKRTNHCDTKVNNILFDKDSNEVLAVIDLDTVMPGFVLSDIGDFIRTATNTGAEDEEDTAKIGVNMDIFKAYTEGYMEYAKEILTPEEVKMLPYGGRLMTYMQTVRFLTDYLNGDTYYKTHKPEHNLIRTKAQLALLHQLEKYAPEMDAFMEKWL